MFSFSLCHSFDFFSDFRFASGDIRYSMVGESNGSHGKPPVKVLAFFFLFLYFYFDPLRNFISYILVFTMKGFTSAGNYHWEWSNCNRSSHPPSRTHHRRDNQGWGSSSHTTPFFSFFPCHCYDFLKHSSLYCFFSQNITRPQRSDNLKRRRISNFFIQ